MRQMEISKKAEKDVTDRLAQRVEDEVIQKLSRAAILSNMFKASQTGSATPIEEYSSSGEATSKRDMLSSTRLGEMSSQARSTRGPSTAAPSSRLESKGETRSHKRDETRRNSGLRNGGGADSSILRVSTQERGKSVGGNVRDDYDRSRVPLRSSTAASAARPVDVEPEDPVKANRRVIASLEAECSKMIDEIRKNKSLLQDFCLLGPATGAPDYVTKSNQLEMLLRSELEQHAGHVGTQYQAFSDNLAHKLWTNRQKKLQLFHSVVSSGSKAASANEGMIGKVRTNNIDHAMTGMLLIVDVVH